MAFSKILVPFDGSSYSMKAFKAALGVAKKHKSKVFVLSCLEKDNLGAWYVDKRINKQIISDAKKYAKSFLTKLEKTAEQSQIPVSINIQETKSIAKEIIDFSESRKINLIIMGSHGQTGFNRLVLGSVSNKISQLSKCPVLIIK
ncbi:MAG: universal stress protein [Nitrosopumilaceae archaeon]|jgi:nucleotide-binding universal stress UspA family protein